MPPKFDEKDAAALQEAQTRRDLAFRARPRVGDIIRFPNGAETRVTYVWADHCQTVGKHGPASFALLWDGECSYSGSLDRGVMHEHLRFTGERKQARAWIFHHGIAMAHNGVDVMLNVHVFESSVPREE